EHGLTTPIVKSDRIVQFATVRSDLLAQIFDRSDEIVDGPRWLRPGQRGRQNAAVDRLERPLRVVLLDRLNARQQRLAGPALHLINTIRIQMGRVATFGSTEAEAFRTTCI